MHSLRSSSKRAAALAAVAFAALLVVAPRAGAENGLVRLYGWYSSATNDNFATTDPTWAATRSGEVRGAYRFDRVIGQVFDPARPQPPNTRKLYRWWSPSRGDMFTTSDPAWAGGPGDTRTPDYVFQRMEGYVHTTVRMGTRPLSSWYSPTREDNYLTSEPEWSGAIGRTQYGYTLFRNEGYAVNPPGGAYPDFGFERMTARINSPYANRRPAQGPRPLLVVLLSYLPAPGEVSTISHPLSSFNALFRGPDYPNIRGYFNENSYGRFTWSIPAIMSLQYPGTRPQAEAAGNRSIGATVVSLAAAAGFNFCAYDRAFGSNPPDGRITADELGVIWLGAAEPTENWGQTVNVTDPAGVTVACPSGWSRPSVVVYANTSGVPEGASLTLVAHELTHQLGADDIYGACGCMSWGSTLMSGNFGPDDDRSFHLDPWHKIQLGWVKPRVYAITNPRTSLRLDRMQGLPSAAAPEPVLLYDPSAGRLGKREYFLLEYRTPLPGTYDRNIFDQYGGLAAWYVQTNSLGNLTSARDIYAAGDYKTDWVVGSPPDTDPTGLLGQSTLWRESKNWWSSSTSCSSCLRWLDGTDSTIRFRTAGQSSTGIDVEWRRSTDSSWVSTRIDSLSRASAPPGASFLLYGDFGALPDVKRVYLVNKLTRVRLAVSAWRAGQVTVTVPSTAPAGAYNIVVYSDSGLTVASNSMPFTVTAP